MKTGSVLWTVVFAMPTRPIKLIRYCIIQWISKLPGSFEIPWVRVLSKCSFIWNTGPVNIWNEHIAQKNLYAGHVSVFPNFNIIFLSSPHCVNRCLQACFISCNMLIVCFNCLVRGRCSCNIELVVFKLISKNDILSISCKIALRLFPKDLCHWLLINIGSPHGSVLSDNKPFPEPMLTQIFVTIWCH